MTAELLLLYKAYFCRHVCTVQFCIFVEFWQSFKFVHEVLQKSSNLIFNPLHMCLKNFTRVAEDCREPSGNFTVSGEWSPCLYQVYVSRINGPVCPHFGDEGYIRTFTSVMSRMSALHRWICGHRSHHRCVPWIHQSREFLVSPGHLSLCMGTAWRVLCNSNKLVLCCLWLR